MYRKLVLVFFLCALIFYDEIFAQDPYRYRRFDNRYEGRISYGVSAPDLELISFIAFCEDYNLDSDFVLKLKFFMRFDTTLYIIARDIYGDKNYRMRPIQNQWPRGWQEFLPWPTNVILKHLMIPSDELGIIGRMCDDRIGSGIYVPLICYHSGFRNHINNYMLHFEAGQNFQIIEYDIQRRLLRPNRYISINRDRLRNQFSRTSFSITLNFSNQPSGLYRIILNCTYRNRTGATQRTYYFYHELEVQ